MPSFLHDQVAQWIVAGAAAIVAVGEVVSSRIGSSGRLRPSGRSRGSAIDAHGLVGVLRVARGTRTIVACAVVVGIGSALAIAQVSVLRAYASNWGAFSVAIALVLAGTGLRNWAILALGSYFRRTVTIVPDQQLVRRGPYRLLRHPSYTGLLLMFTGFALAFGSWLGAAVAFACVFFGMVLRIRVEEQALARAFGPAFSDYASATARLLPHVW